MFDLPETVSVTLYESEYRGATQFKGNHYQYILVVNPCGNDLQAGETWLVKPTHSPNGHILFCDALECVTKMSEPSGSPFAQLEQIREELPLVVEPESEICANEECESIKLSLIGYVLVARGEVIVTRQLCEECVEIMIETSPDLIYTQKDSRLRLEAIELERRLKREEEERRRARRVAGLMRLKESLV